MATKYVRASYQEVLDLNTEDSKVTAIGIHTPTGDTPRRMFKGYFDQYKKFRYVGASLKFVPLARLPADPSQVGYEAGDLMDPRDLANPILVHGCHGDDLGGILNQLYTANSEMDSITPVEQGLVSGGSVIGVTDPWYSVMERLYYKALTDRTWAKAGPQQGFFKGHLRPLIYTLATNHPMLPNSKDVDFETGGIFDGFESGNNNGVITTKVVNDAQFFTPRLTKLGWLDTRMPTTAVSTGQFATEGNDGEKAAVGILDAMKNSINYTELPKLFMLCILLPPAYKQEMYFRAIITHHFAFKDFRGISFMPENTTVPYYNATGDNSLQDPGTIPEVDLGNSEGGSGGTVPPVNPPVSEISTPRYVYYDDWFLSVC